MIERTFSARPANLTFTLDFHELVRGDLGRGRSVRLRYEPLRLVPPGEPYVFGDPARPVTAHARFGGDSHVDLVLVSAVGMQPDRTAPPTGDGNMLVGTLEVPGDAGELELWFSFVSKARGTVYDSDFGRNFHFGFAREQIAVIDADVVAKPDRGEFTLKVSAVTEVDRVVAHVESVDPGVLATFEVDLVPAKATARGWRNWSVKGRTTPVAAKLRFKIYYWIGGIRYKEDNDGLYYLAPQPPAEAIPAPPADLAAAAHAWR